MTTIPPTTSSTPSPATPVLAAGSSMSGAAVTAGAALVAGILVVARLGLPKQGGQTDYSSVAWVAVVLGAVALVLVAVASYEWPIDRFKWIGRLFGADGVAGRLSAAVGWIASAVAAIVVATIALPQLVTAWKPDPVFAAGLLGLTLLAVLGWGPSITRGWPTGFRLSTLTVLGSVVALALVAAYLFFLWILTGKTTAEADEWARLVELRATLEALAFAAAGALIGQTVARTAVGGELNQKDQTIQQQAGQLQQDDAVIAEKDQVVDGKNTALAGALNLLTPEDVEVTSDNFQHVTYLRQPEAPTLDQTKIEEARRKLVEGLKIGR